MQEDIAQMAHRSHTSEEMEDHEPLPEDEEEELIILDPEHVCSFTFNLYTTSVFTK